MWWQVIIMGYPFVLLEIDMNEETEAALKATIGYSEIARMCVTCFWFKEVLGEECMWCTGKCICTHSNRGAITVLREAHCDFWVYKHTKPNPPAKSPQIER